jgi:dienelactone hydrolase
MSCADCYTGHEHAGTPRGSETSQPLHGLPTYVSRPAGEPKGAVVFIPDMFGWRFVNNRLLCDAYAEKGGFVVYLPDLMAGEFGGYFFLCF